MMFFQERTLARLHAYFVGVVGVVVTEHVQHSVCHEQSQLVIEAAGMFGGLSLGHRRAQHDVTQQQGVIVTVGLRTVGPARNVTGSGRIVDQYGVDGERENIRRPDFVHVNPVQFGDHILVDEQETQFGRATDPFGRQDAGGESSPALDVDGAGGLLVGAEHLNDPLTADVSRAAPLRENTHHSDRRRD
jgi:hypothetical protein